MQKNIKNSLTGFTLVEIIVAVGIFAAVAVIATGSLLLLIDAQRKAFSVQQTYDNLRFSLETIIKDLRTGALYHCGDDSVVPFNMPQDCPNGDVNIVYTNSAGNQVTYRINAGRIEKIVGAVSGSLTPPDITVNRMDFYVIGAEDSTDGIYPRVTVVIEATAGTGRSATTFTLQTTIAQRKIIL